MKCRLEFGISALNLWCVSEIVYSICSHALTCLFDVSLMSNLNIPKNTEHNVKDIYRNIFSKYTFGNVCYLINCYTKCYRFSTVNILRGILKVCHIDVYQVYSPYEYNSQNNVCERWRYFTLTEFTVINPIGFLYSHFIRTRR